MFDIHVLPADHGDCFWIEYGKGKDVRRVLIDGGTQHSYSHLAQKIKDFPGKIVYFELFVITHVDADHIGGSLELLRNIEMFGKEIVFDDVWFNGWKHLKNDRLGDLQGELLSDHLRKRNLPWNKYFGEKAVVVPDDGPLPVIDLPGGLKLTLMSPSRGKLNKLRERWEKTITKANLILGQVEDKQKYFEKPADLLGGDELPDVAKLSGTKFTGDKTVANGSSIAFLAEYTDAAGKKSVLFTGDAHADILVSSIKRLVKANDPRIQNGRLPIDLLKVSHHGSKNNISRELIEILDCPKYCFSTSGQQFKHPDKEAVARTIAYGKTSDEKDPRLFFNYRTNYNKIWEDSGLQFKYDYEAEYPKPGSEGLLISL